MHGDPRRARQGVVSRIEPNSSMRPYSPAGNANSKLFSPLLLGRAAGAPGTVGGPCAAPLPPQSAGLQGSQKFWSPPAFGQP